MPSTPVAVSVQFMQYFRFIQIILFEFIFLNFDDNLFQPIHPSHYTVISLGDPFGESLFLQCFGKKSPVLKILDFLMDNVGSDYSKTEIAQGTDISRGTVFNVWPSLESLELVVQTREVGRAKMYKLNKKNPIVRKLIELDDAISDFYASKHINTDVEIMQNASQSSLSSAGEQLQPEKESILCGSVKALI